jgi:hypothetical protein
MENCSDGDTSQSNMCIAPKRTRRKKTNLGRELIEELERNETFVRAELALTRERKTAVVANRDANRMVAGSRIAMIQREMIVDEKGV